jgi:hypothetical protein
MSVVEVHGHGRAVAPKMSPQRDCWVAVNKVNGMLSDGRPSTVLLFHPSGRRPATTFTRLLTVLAGLASDSPYGLRHDQFPSRRMRRLWYVSVARSGQPPPCTIPVRT